MTDDRLKDIPGFSIDRVAAAVWADADVLRLENLDTDLRPPQAALEATRAAIDEDDANSYLPFLGSAELRQVVARHVSRLSGVAYDPDRQCVITAGGMEGLLNVLLATLNPGDEVLLTDPTYAGMICRVRLAGVCCVSCRSFFERANGGLTWTPWSRPSPTGLGRCSL